MNRPYFSYFLATIVFGLAAGPAAQRQQMEHMMKNSGLLMKMDMSTQAHWLGKDCQGIKPIG